jgi:hypothetical protein
LSNLGAQSTSNNKIAIVGWIQAEGSGCAYNPLDTTLALDGSSRCNSVGVQNYKDLNDGVIATVKTISVNAYGSPSIVSCLKRSCDPVSTAGAIAASSWGTGQLAVECITEAAHDPSVYAQWAAKPING